MTGGWRAGTGYITIPSDVVSIVTRLADAGYRAYVVGGTVRDLLLGDVPEHWHVATGAGPAAISGLFGRDAQPGERFGTVAVATGQRIVEVATFRDVDGNCSGIETDLLNRDITINAMALAADMTLLDPTGGRNDLNRRLVRCVGDPHRCFSADPVRMLRAVRLAADRDLTLEHRTLAAIRSVADAVASAPGDRVAEELDRMLLSRNAERVITHWAEAGLASPLFCELNRDVLGWARAALLVECLPAQAPVRMAGLIVGLGKVPAPESVAAIGSRLRWNGKMRDGVSRLCGALPGLEEGEVSDYRLCRIASGVGRSWILPLAGLADARSQGRTGFTGRCTGLLAASVPLTVEELAIDGAEIMSLTGMDAGPEIGLVLQAALESVWEDPSRNTTPWLERFALDWRMRTG